MTKLSLEQIKTYWQNQALVYQNSPKASWSDQQVIDLEIKELLNYLESGDRILDIGCANGYSTINLAMAKNINIKGIDYIPEMIAFSKKNLEQYQNNLKGKVKFAVGDILDLTEPKNSYDKIIIIRVIINLHTWENQAKALSNALQRLKKGGLLLLSEATLQGWQRLNALRQEWGLTDIAMPEFNEYLDENKVITLLSRQMKLVNIVNFASTYYVGTRLLKPLLIKALQLDTNAADPNMEWNRWFAQLPQAGDYGTQKLFVFKKVK